MATATKVSADEIVDALIAKELKAKTVVASEAAARVVAKLESTNPDALYEYLMGHAEDIIRQRITLVTRNRNTEIYTAAKKFSDAAVHAENGNPEPLSRLMDLQYTVNDNNLRKKLALMNREECIFAADYHSNIAQTNEMRASFLRAVSRSLRGAKTVGEVFTEEKLNNVFNKFMGSEI